jgi:hypothetical protein
MHLNLRASREAIICQSRAYEGMPALNAIPNRSRAVPKTRVMKGVFREIGVPAPPLVTSMSLQAITGQLYAINENSDTAQEFDIVYARPLKFPLMGIKHAHSERYAAPGVETHLYREWRRRLQARGG